MGSKWTWIGSLVISGILLAMPFMPMEWWQSLPWKVMGRLHPILLHLPIVAVVACAYLEWRYSTYTVKGVRSIRRMSWIFSFYAVLLTVFAGFLLYKSGDYTFDGVRNHFYAGIALALFMVWSMHFHLLYQRSRSWRFRQFSRMLLFLCLPLVLYTGHTGGSLTHGEDFITEPIDKHLQKRALAATPAMNDPASMKIYHDMITPFLKQRCESCHNARKSKGGLDLSSYDALIKGGKSGKPMLTAGNPEESEVWVRVSLEENHDDYMPPEGKQGLSKTEKDILAWWIEKGASQTDTLGAGPEDPDLKQRVDEYLPTLAIQQVSAEAQRLERLKVGPKLKRVAFDLGFEVELDAASDSTYYALSMKLPPRIITDDVLAKLMPYRHLFSKVSLVSADITDDGLYYLGQMPNLKTLILSKSCIKGDGLVYLQDLPNLQLLNLSYTDVNDKTIMHITQFQNLKEVYLFDTFVQPNVLEALNEFLSEAEVSVGEGPYY